jgi:serine/threonine protein kinase
MTDVELLFTVAGVTARKAGRLAAVPLLLSTARASRTAAVAAARTHTMPTPVDMRSILGKSANDPKLEELYVLDKQIGKGAFGVVRLGHNKATDEKVAVKSISKAKLTCKEDVQDVQAEVAIMNLVAGHGNVVMLEVRAGQLQLQHCSWAFQLAVHLTAGLACHQHDCCL